MAKKPPSMPAPSFSMPQKSVKMPPVSVTTTLPVPPKTGKHVKGTTKY